MRGDGAGAQRRCPGLCLVETQSGQAGGEAEADARAIPEGVPRIRFRKARVGVSPTTLLDLRWLGPVKTTMRVLCWNGAHERAAALEPDCERIARPEEEAFHL